MSIEHMVDDHVPRLRFGEFKGAWEEKKLSDICISMSSGKSINKSDSNGIWPIYGSTGIIGRSHTYDYDGQNILVARVGANAGSIYQVRGNYSVSDNTLILRLRNTFDINFIFMLLMGNKIKKLVFGSGQPLITAGQLTLLRVSIPNDLEQHKIAAFLTAIDKKINALQKKKELLEKYKNGVMRAIFSQNLRFKREHGQYYPGWRESSLGSIGEIIGGGTPDTAKDEYWDGEINWLTPTEVKTKYLSSTKTTISGMGLTNSSAKILPVGTVIFTSRATVGDVAIAKVPMATNQGFQSIAVNTQNSNEFIYYWITINKQQFLRRSSGSTFPEISKNEMRKIKILLPPLDEQQKIADFLFLIDDRIILAGKELEQTQRFKKALLQQMFV